jgi:hypothetical protein
MKGAPSSLKESAVAEEPLIATAPANAALGDSAQDSQQVATDSQ